MLMDAQLIAYMRWRESLPDLTGLDPDAAWEAFRSAHEEACAVCRATAKKLVIDHCHVTGWIRGLLCLGCNQRARPGGRNVPLENRWTNPTVTAYCQLPPADIAGLQRRYEPPYRRDPTEALPRALWHVGSRGTESGADILDRELIEHMRNRDWSGQ